MRNVFDYIGRIILILLVVFCVLFLIFLFVGAERDARIGAACIRYGYPDHRTTFNSRLQFHGVCVRFEEGTQVIVPLEALEIEHE